MSEVDVASVAKEVSAVDETVMKVLPAVAGIVGFIPGGQIAPELVPLVNEFLGAVDGAAKTVASGKPDATPQDIFQELIDHMTTGKKNSPLLS